MPGIPRVLVVDYDPKNLHRLSEMFRRNGYQVEVATDGVSAMAAFTETHPDIVLLEAMIPKKHGFEVCQEIKKTPAGKSTPVIIMTAVYKGRKYRSQAMHVHGCDEYVEKPCAPETILELVMRFVPPERTAMQAVAAGHGARAAVAVADKRGEVIQFPSGRSGLPAPPEMDDETEREIMSRLDEILPDTPLFDEQRIGEDDQALSTGESALDLGSAPVPGGADEPDSYELEIEGDEPAPSDVPTYTAPLISTPIADSVGVKPAGDRPARVATPVREREPSRPRPARSTRAEAEASAPKVSPVLVVCLGIAIVALILWYISRI